MKGIDIVVKRRELGIKQWELAQLLVMPASELSQIETGRRPMSPELEDRIKTALEQLKKEIYGIASRRGK